MGFVADAYTRCRKRPSTFHYVNRRLDHTLSTLGCFSEPPASFASATIVFSLRPAATFISCLQIFDVLLRYLYALSISLNIPHFISTTLTEELSPHRTVSICTPPPVYAEVFSVSENTYARAQLTFQSIERFLLALLCICVTCFITLLDLVFFFNKRLFSLPHLASNSSLNARAIVGKVYGSYLFLWEISVEKHFCK